MSADLLELYVALDGDDSWSGRRPSANRRATDGPLATLHGAIRRLRKFRRDRSQSATPVRIVLRHGLHPLRRPLKLTACDSGTAAHRAQWHHLASESPVSFVAYPGETPVVSGGRTLTGWKLEELDGREVWVARLPQVKRGSWNFSQLFVDGQRRFRPRLPRSGEFRIRALTEPGDDGQPWTGGNRSFAYHQGDLRHWHNLQDVEIVAMHVWLQSRMRIARLDAEQGIVHLDRPSQGRLNETHINPVPCPYYVENVFEALEPGEWYLDRPAGKLYYMPLPGEHPPTAEVIAPVLDSLIQIEGDVPRDRFVEALHFEGLTFAHCEWQLKPNSSGCGQAAAELPAAVSARGLRHASFKKCRFLHIESRHYGGWGIYTDEGSSDVLIESNLVCRAKTGSFHQHFGRDNLVVNNIFACGHEAQIQQTRDEPHVTCRFVNNIVYFDSGELFSGPEGHYMEHGWAPANVAFERNLYFDASGRPLCFLGLTFAQWQKRGFDTGSLIADPKFRAPEKGDFSLKRNSPALALGFRPFDLSDVGPR